MLEHLSVKLIGDTVKMSTIVSTISVVLVGFVSLVVMSSFDNFSGLVPRISI